MTERQNAGLAPEAGGSSPRVTKSQRRDDARAQALRLREEQERQARRQRTIVISLAVVGLLLVAGVVGFIFWSAAQDGGRAGGTVDVPELSEAEDPFEGIAAPAGATDDGAIPVGTAGVAGEGAEAADPVVVRVYADFICPFCALFEESNGAVLEELRAQGDVVVEYVPVSILDRTSSGSQYSTRAAAAVAYVADRAPEAFVEFHDQLFANQPEEGTTGLDDAQIAQIARDAGVPEEVAADLEDRTYLGDEGFVPWVAATTEQASRDLPRFATPTIFVDGEELSTLGVDWRVEGALAAAVDRARG